MTALPSSESHWSPLERLEELIIEAMEPLKEGREPTALAAWEVSPGYTVTMLKSAFMPLEDGTRGVWIPTLTLSYPDGRRRSLFRYSLSSDNKLLEPQASSEEDLAAFLQPALQESGLSEDVALTQATALACRVICLWEDSMLWRLVHFYRHERPQQAYFQAMIHIRARRLCRA